MRNSIIITLIFITLMLAASSTGGGESPRLLNGSVFKGLSRGDVKFPHDRHYGWGIGCMSCHHRYERGMNVLVREDLVPGTRAVSCPACHVTGRDLERVYHRMCIGCHDEMKRKSINSGPVMCDRCHLKEEGER